MKNFQGTFPVCGKKGLLYRELCDLLLVDLTLFFLGLRGAQSIFLLSKTLLDNFLSFPQIVLFSTNFQIFVELCDLLLQ